MISAKIIRDSISKVGVRLTTMELEYPRVIHAELMTHRVFSRNASSSRAIPTKRMLKNMATMPALPAEWRMNEPGMQGFTAAPADIVEKAEAIYARNRQQCIDDMLEIDALGLHKQHSNRLGECHQHIKVVVTATQWANWFGLRNHPAADPTIQALAREMYAAMQSSKPDLILSDDWHLPYVTTADEEHVWDTIKGKPLRDNDLLEILIKISAARCARVSYNNFDGSKTNVASDLDLYEKLVGDHPLHASPTEHQACPDHKHWVDIDGEPTRSWKSPHLHGNFVGWCQHRKTLAGENLEVAA